jgi:hypothetical protein
MAKQRAKMMAGYGFELEAGQPWKSSADDYWEISMVDGVMADVVGRRTIDGSPVNVFKHGGTYYAQTGPPIAKPRAKKKTTKKKTAEKIRQLGKEAKEEFYRQNPKQIRLAKGYHAEVSYTALAGGGWLVHMVEPPSPAFPAGHRYLMRPTREIERAPTLAAAAKLTRAWIKKLKEDGSPQLPIPLRHPRHRPAPRVDAPKRKRTTKKKATRRTPREVPSRSTGAPRKIMTQQEAHDWLISKGFRGVPGSSRYEDPAGNTGRIEFAYGAGPSTGDTWRVTIERAERPKRRPGGQGAKTLAKLRKKTTKKKTTKKKNGGSVWERQGREHGRHHAMNRTDAGRERLIAMEGASSFGAGGLDADASEVPEAYRNRYLVAWRKGALDQSRELQRERKRSGRKVDPDFQIRLTFGAVRNKDTRVGGWVPMVWKDGKEERSPWQGVGYERDQALALAERQANEEGNRYLGDWDVTVAERPSAAKGRGKPILRKHYADVQKRMRAYLNEKGWTSRFELAMDLNVSEDDIEVAAKKAAKQGKPFGEGSREGKWSYWV